MTTSILRIAAAAILGGSVLACANAQVPPEFGGADDRGEIENDLVNEASGLAASRRNAGVLWTHNDSGDTTRVFAMTEGGEDLGQWILAGASARDWEDIAVGPGPAEGTSYLYVAEIGDNNAQYETKMIFRVPEPEVDAADDPASGTLDGVETITYRYPDGARDAEALMVDPATRDLYVVSKREASVRLYRLPWPQSTSEIITAEYVVALDTISMITAGDISSDGSEIIIKNYTTVYYWNRGDGESVGEAMSRTASILPYTVEPQGEAIAWRPDGSGYFTLSEEPANIQARLYLYARHGVSEVREENDDQSYLDITRGE